MNRLYTMLKLLSNKGYTHIISCESKECFKIKEYILNLDTNEDIEGDLRKIILSPTDIFIGMFIEGCFYKMFKVVV